MDIPWLDQFSANWRTSVKQDRAPHALMLLGAAGTGKRCAAAWLARCCLGRHLRGEDEECGDERVQLVQVFHVERGIR